MKSLKDFIEEEIKNYKEPPTETFEYRVLDKLKTRYKLIDIFG
jgi:hypothetical protein